MGLIALLVGSLRVLSRTGRLFLAFGVIALAMMFRGRAVRLGGVFVMFGGLVMLVSCHCKPRR
jgi:hypothetical protein